MHGELVQHENWLLGRGVLVEDGGIRADRRAPWNLYRVGKGLAAHVELDGGYHVVQVSDLDRFDDEQAFLSALQVPVRDGFEVRGETIAGDQLCVDVRTMSLTINGRPREGWLDMLHDSPPMRSVRRCGTSKSVMQRAKSDRRVLYFKQTLELTVWVPNNISPTWRRCARPDRRVATPMSLGA